MNWLFDTNIISETRKPRPNEAVTDWIGSVSLSQMHTASVNIAELVYGAECQDDLIKRRELLRWVNEDVRGWFSERTHEVTENVLVRWRHATRVADAKRQHAPATDLLIASVAAEYQLSVATRDVAPFVTAGLPVFNPFTGERFNGA